MQGDELHALKGIRYSAPLVEQNDRDDPKITLAIAWLTKARIPFSRAAPHQLKIGNLSFYPVSGTLNFDGCRREPVRGLTGLKAILEGNLNCEFPEIDENAEGVGPEYPVEEM